MTIKCKKCNEIITTELGKLITCSCRSIYLDLCYITKEGKEIIRIGGKPEDIEFISS